MRKLLICVVGTVLLAGSSARAATTNFVSNVTELTNAVARATQNGTVIILSEGTYDLMGCAPAPASPTIHLKFANLKPVALIGDPAVSRDKVVLRGEGEASGKRIIYMDKGFLRLENLTIENAGNSAFYLSSLQGGTAITNCVFRDNCTTNGSGGAIGFYVNGGSVATGSRTIHKCAFVNNRAFGVKNNNGGAFSGNTVQFTECVFSNNWASSSGGAVCGGDYRDCEFFGNWCNAVNSGGVLVSAYQDSSCIGCHFVSNYNAVVGTGSALFAWGQNIYFLTVSNCTFVGNHAYGAQLFYGGKNYAMATYMDCTFKDNISTNGTFANGANLYQRCRFIGNKSLAKDVSSANAVVEGTFENCLFADNEGGGTHGNSYFIGAAAKLYNCTVANNTFGNKKRSIANYDCTCVNCAFYGNDPEIYASADLRVPSMRNCFWSAQDATNETAQARIDAVSTGGGLLAPSRFKFVGTGDAPWTIASSSKLRDAGWSDDDYQALVGDYDIDFGDRVKFDAIDVGCYECQKLPGLMLLLR